MKHSEIYRININDVDCGETAGLSAVMRFFQDCAECAIEEKRPSTHELAAQNKAFVLAGINISIYKPLYCHDDIAVYTWATESGGASFERCFQMKRSGSLVAEATSVWALLDRNTKKLVRVADFDNNYDEDEPIDLDAPKHLRIPKELNMRLVGEYTVAYKDIDRNMHMNNTVYGNLLCGFIPDFIGSRVIKCEISYKSEAPLDENIKVYLAEKDGVYYFRTVCRGKTNVEAEIITERM